MMLDPSMKILIVSAALGVGGAEVVATTLATTAAAEGHDVCIASGPGHHVDRLGAAGVAHVSLRTVGRNPIDLLRSAARLRRLPLPDVVHAHNPKAAVVCRLAFGHRVPILTTLHGVAAAESAAAARLLAWASDHVVAVSPHLADDLVRHGFPPWRVQVVTNGIAPPPSHDRAAARAELGLAPDAVVALCPARLVNQKRHDLLLEAWAAQPRPATLLLAGDGPHRQRIVDTVARLELGPSVQILGDRTDIPRLLAASDVVALATDWEGLPISLLEAMAAGVPIVASRVGGIVEHLGDAVHLVEPGSAPALAAGLTDLIGDPHLRSDLAARGRALVTDRFGVDRMVDRYRAIYRELPADPAGRPALIATSGDKS